MHPKLRRLQSEAASLISDLSSQMEELFDLGATTAPRIAVTRSDNKLTLRAEIPGYEKEDVKVRVEDDVLIIKVTKKKSEEKGTLLTSSIHSFEKMWELPPNAIVDEIEADVRAGILAVTVPLKTDQAHTRDVPIG